MFGIGGFNPLQMISQAALAVATGGTSLIAQIAMQVATQIASQVLQQVGEKLGLPQSVIDMAQGAMFAASGNPAAAAQEYTQAASSGLGSIMQNAGSAFGASPAAVGQATREVQSAAKEVESIAEQQTNAYMKEALEGKDEDGNSNKGKRAMGANAGAGQSFLMRLAIALGGVIDGKMDEQLEKAREIDGKKASGDKSTLSTDGAILQALAQEISIMSNALNNSMKAIGEAVSTLARKG